MSFGFSVVDFITVGNLVHDIVERLRHAPSEYQELRRELEWYTPSAFIVKSLTSFELCLRLYSLQRALVLVDRLELCPDQTISLDRIKCAALMCKYPLEDFLRKIRKYEKSLGIKQENSQLKVMESKIRWAFVKKEEITELRSQLNVLIGNINMMLLTQGLKQSHTTLAWAKVFQKETNDQITGLFTQLERLGGNVDAANLAAERSTSSIRKLFWLARKQIVAPIQTISETVAKIW